MIWRWRGWRWWNVPGSPPIAAAVMGEAGGALLEWGRLDEALAHLTHAAQVSMLSGYSDSDVFLYLTRSRIAGMAGDIEEADRWLQAALDVVQTFAPVAIREEVLTQQIGVLLAQDQPEAAEAILSAEGFRFFGRLVAPDFPAEQGIGRPVAELYLSALRIVLYHARTGGWSPLSQDGLELAGRLLAAARENHTVSTILESLLIRAQLWAVRGDSAAAEADILAALQQAEPEGYVTIIVEAGEPVARLLVGLWREGRLESLSPDYMARLRAAYPAHLRSLWDETAGAPQPLVEPLSARELEILHLIGEGYSNQAIAGQLVITLHTVKKHTSNIYGKLGVGSRTQAVARARELGLI
ncbi:MAG: LuxR C-terminal-related transcriptional regulator [Chloroflexota bacterium]